MFKTMTSALIPKKNPNHPSQEDINKIPPFIFCKWLSGDQYTINAANELNFYHKIPIENQYWMIKNAFGGKIRYIPYPKKEDNNISKKVDYLSRHFKISEEKAKEYLEFISYGELNEIVEMYEDYEIKHG